MSNVGLSDSAMESDDGCNTSSPEKIMIVDDVEESDKTALPEVDVLVASKNNTDDIKGLPLHTVSLDKEVKLTCPRVNCPEKIVFCLDLSNEMERVNYRSRSGDKFASIKLIKRALGLFVHSKNAIDKRHEFALVVLHDKALWVLDFTDTPEDVINFVDDLTDSRHSDTFDLDSVFEVIRNKIALPKIIDPCKQPPPYIVRVILIYGRSHCIPSFKNSAAWQALEASPYFFVDVFYSHEPKAEGTLAEESFHVLCDLDTKGQSYIFSVSSNPTKLYDYMAMLLAHPLLRATQRNACYTLNDSSIS